MRLLPASATRMPPSTMRDAVRPAHAERAARLAAGILVARDEVALAEDQIRRQLRSRSGCVSQTSTRRLPVSATKRRSSAMATP